MVAAWEAIRNLISEKSRDLRQRRRRVVEEDDHDDRPPSNPDVSQQFAQPEIEETSSLPVLGKVKWFNPNKRYGFIELSDGSGDAFLHASALAGIGVSTLQPGETLE